MKILKSLLVSSVIFIIVLCPVLAAAKNALEGYSVGVIKDDVLHVNAAEAAAILDRHSEVIVLDVRTPKEHAKEKVRDGLNIDYYADDFKERLAVLDKDQRYLVHCRSGVRSGRTLPLMRELGFTHIIHLDGGILAWQALRE